MANRRIIKMKIEIKNIGESRRLLEITTTPLQKFYFRFSACLPTAFKKVWGWFLLQICNRINKFHFITDL
jgi:hypothetical protein